MRKLAGIPGITVATEFAQKLVPGSSWCSPLLNATAAGCLFRRRNSIPGTGGFSNGKDTCYKPAWLLKKSLQGQKLPKSDDQKCIPRRRKSFIGHPSASSFLREEAKRVFQQPPAITLRINKPSIIVNANGEQGRLRHDLPDDAAAGLRGITERSGSTCSGRSEDVVARIDENPAEIVKSLPVWPSKSVDHLF